MFRHVSIFTLYYQAAHKVFSQEKMLDQSGARREEMLRELATAFDTFTELKSNLEEGTKVSCITDCVGGYVLDPVGMVWS